MGILGGILGLVDDIVSIPTDLIGLTNHHDKKDAIKKIKIAFVNGDITESEYKKLLIAIQDY